MLLKNATSLAYFFLHNMYAGPCQVSAENSLQKIY